MYLSPTGINQFNPMAVQNTQMPQAPMGARTPSPRNHPQQMNMNSMPAVRYTPLFRFVFLSLFSCLEAVIFL